ncbi:glycosyltransferase [Paenibacillus oralis]|uniref:Glycosyltransferase n=1 Tax=Paenibacillus oralis TaxID=2490856 RepID=A0A3P3TXX9_9BACL|nr:glycosyltransferase [Paenibacillus oralis]RRJ62700.1 glycosyltransferase [Paenibacillus oralis]
MSEAVSIITCTKRRRFMNALFRNYNRQNYKRKELIVILNHKNLKLHEYIRAAKPFQNVKIYSLPDNVPLGQCLNYGVKRAKHSLIAKFDDDDYYAPNYLPESIQAMQKTNADIVGKRAHYMQLIGNKQLLLRYPGQAKKYVPLVQGATLLVKRQVFNKVSFPARNRRECVKFCAACRAKGFKIYAGSPSNFMAVRRSNSQDHTWIVSDKSLLTKNVKLLKVKNMRKFVSQPV